MIKRFVLWLLREELDAIENQALENVSAAKHQLAYETNQAFTKVGLELKRINDSVVALQSDLLAYKTTTMDNVADTHAILEAIAAEVDMLGGAVAHIEEFTDNLFEQFDEEMDVNLTDLEERITALEGN